MSNIINKEKLVSGLIFGDPANEEYIYMPGGEIGSPFPVCVLERNSVTEDISLEEAAELIGRLHLKTLNIAPFSKI